MAETSRKSLKRNAVATAALVCLAATGLAGCGEQGSDEPFAGQSADDIAAKAVKATRDAESVRIAGTSKPQGAPQAMTVDFQVDEQDNCQGTMTMKDAKADVRQAGQSAYVKGNEPFWQAALQGQPGTDKAIAQLQGKWVKSKPGDSSTQGMCDKQSMLAAMDDDKSERKGLKRGETTEVEGKEALTLTKEQGDGEKLTLYVATEGEPFILKTVTRGGKQPGEATFTDYNAKVRVEQPPAGEVVDPAKVSVSG
ncbi:hypothetical protein [Streptomyces sp. ODS05-4]|uniref:hypothetical protein n=1 Tax=Streptomyces sp. ODS05-4 TaxID=2944939 RepID=UPI00210C4874|nr:hypothetical protein [Streptomyces sp. ODS05-4]